MSLHQTSVEIYELFKDLGGLIATVTASAAGVFVTYKISKSQMKIAKTQSNTSYNEFLLKTYDERENFLDTISNYLYEIQKQMFASQKFKAAPGGPYQENLTMPARLRQIGPKLKPDTVSKIEYVLKQATHIQMRFDQALDQNDTCERSQSISSLLDSVFQLQKNFASIKAEELRFTLPS